MNLVAGARLGPYEIQSAIGAGGMGEVYKARDTRLDRTVAIKILPPALAADPDRRARFAREAKAIAGLNHAHICALYDVGDHDGSIFLVMEYIAGETLAARLRKGPLPIEQALTVATEIADGLAAAHRHGIIHRDLKPANVMLTKAGAKLLDFGLAKPEAPPIVAGSAATAVRTQEGATGIGVLLGTVPYMAPEQLEGKEADARTDIFSFGVVLYEMLTGRQAFEGESHASVIAAILGREPVPLSSVQPLTPPALDLLVRQCLAKSPDDRPDTAHDIANNLRAIQKTSGVSALPVVQPRPWWRRGLRPARTVAGVAAGMMIGAGLMWLLRPAQPRISLTYPSVDVRPADELSSSVDSEPTFVGTPGGARTALAWTPDGQAIVFAGRRAGVHRLYVRRLDQAEARPLADTDGAQLPAVSADGQWVAFWAGGSIKKAPLGGGPLMELASGLGEPPWGLAWDVRGRLFFGRGDGGSIWMIPPGGAPAAATRVGKGEVAHILPWPLPDGRTVLYTVRKRQWSWGDEEVVAQTLDTGARKVLLKDAVDARYVPTGHLVFLRRGVLFAVPFDAQRLEIRGTPVAVLDKVAQALTASNTDYVTGAGQFAVAANGALAWVPGSLVPYPDVRLVTLDRRGVVSPLSAPARSYGPAARVSPDGRRLAVMIRTITDVGVWLYDVDRGASTLLAGGGEAWIPIWSPDGRNLAFAWLADGRRAMALQPADGTAPPHVLAPGDLTVSSFTPDGRHVAAVRDSRDVVVLSVEPGQNGVQPVARLSQHAERWPEFSPDGRWLAYGSDVSGRFEVYVRPYPGPGPIEPVSVDGGWSPAWARSGRELFFVGLPDQEGKRRLMAVEFVPGSPPRIGRPRPLFVFDPGDLRLACAPVRCFDVAADGERFYATQTLAPPRPTVVTHISLILNWLEALKAKVPAGR
ncbi:MAG: protein kinase domain-containing protein [Bacteroidales bacterium]